MTSSSSSEKFVCGGYFLGCMSNLVSFLATFIFWFLVYNGGKVLN